MGEVTPVLFVLGRLCGLLSPLLLVPLAVGLPMGDRWREVGWAFAAPALLSACLYVVSRRFARGRRLEMETPFQGFLAVVFGWVLFSALGAWPYVHAGALPGFVDGFFETMSGFTTTGASVLRSVEELPRSLLFWRALTQFVGGLGIIALFVAVLPALAAGGVVLFKSEVARSVVHDRLRPRIADTAKVLWWIYAGLAAAQTGALLLCGLSPFDAVCHAFTTVSTGGFSTRDASFAAFSPAAQWVTVLFMFLGGVSFLVHGKALLGDVRAYIRSEEVRLYTFLLVAASAAVFFLLDAGEGRTRPVAEDVRHATFQVVSIMTTTGFATTDFGAWADAARLLLVLLMVVGGCSGSTAGGVKVFRFLFVFRAAGRQVQRLLFPSRVVAVRVDGEPVPDDDLFAAALLVLLFLLFLVAGAFVALVGGVPLLESVSGAFACIGCVGPALGAVGPSGNYADLPAATKGAFALLMLLGRLEIYSVLVLIAGWRLRR